MSRPLPFARMSQANIHREGPNHPVSKFHGTYSEALSVRRAEGAEIAHNHQDKVETVFRFEVHVIPIHITDIQPLAGRSFFCVCDGSRREIDAGHLSAPFRQRRRIQSGPAAEIGDSGTGPYLECAVLSAMVRSVPPTGIAGLGVVGITQHSVFSVNRSAVSISLARTFCACT